MAPLFRKTFALTSTPVRATAYVSSLGWHELYLNGQKVGRDVLAPQVTLMDQKTAFDAGNGDPHSSGGGR